MTQDLPLRQKNGQAETEKPLTMIRSFTGDYFAEADLKLSKRFDGEPDGAKFEDGGFVISYTDPNNFANAFYSVSSAPGVTPPVGYDATGLSGFYFMIDGHQYRVVKADAPADEVEGIPAESCIPYENDASFDEWNKIRVEREGTVLDHDCKWP